MTITEPLPPLEPFYSDFEPRRPSAQEKSYKTSSYDSYFGDNYERNNMKDVNGESSRTTSLGSIFVDNYEQNFRRKLIDEKSGCSSLGSMFVDDYDRNVSKGPNGESRHFQESPLYTQSEYYDGENIYGTSPPVFE